MCSALRSEVPVRTPFFQNKRFAKIKQKKSNMGLIKKSKKKGLVGSRCGKKHFWNLQSNKKKRSSHSRVWKRFRKSAKNKCRCPLGFPRAGMAPRNVQQNADCQANVLSPPFDCWHWSEWTGRWTPNERWTHDTLIESQLSCLVCTYLFCSCLLL